MNRALPSSLALIFVAQCTCGVPGVVDDLYACRTDADCLDTHSCIASRCRPKGTSACATGDCANPSCDHQQCGATATEVCCGSVCANLGTDTRNCGGCGIVCSFNCSPVSTGGVASGHCSCNGNGNGNCPTGQTCNGGQCACGSAVGCASGEVCVSSACHY
jgi:hypothetical protein